MIDVSDGVQGPEAARGLLRSCLHRCRGIVGEEALAILAHALALGLEVLQHAIAESADDVTYKKGCMTRPQNTPAFHVGARLSAGKLMPYRFTAW